ncbi:branched-chain amino acid ABC transporter permease [Chelativorans sp. Marseille-P2723]|uniref:branched-chain amino acid ABC transporter permease n=1 Tax=Chelativorans sp. Marseille-P2723 TaxID=2709133 RepID=UPI001570ECD6|nr:branched-chain amino acid ABC transporter permease [Chelativorans sp. Marseille-P2723]
MLAQQLFNGLVLGAVYALFALGFNLVFGVHKIMNLAHGAIFMVGAFVGLYSVTLGLPLWAAFLIAMVFTGLLSVMIDFVAFRPLRKTGDAEFAMLIASIGVEMILVNLALRASDARTLRFPFGIVPVEPFFLFGMRITPLQFVIAAVAVLCVTLLAFYLYRTSFGRQVRAVSSNERAAMLLGVEPRMIYLQTFFISGLLAGLAGVLIGLAFNSINFSMGEPYLLRGFVVLILGGLGSLRGAVVAGLALGIIQTLSVAYFPTGLTDIIVYSLLFAVLLVRPNGLFGDAVSDARVARR